MSFDLDSFIEYSKNHILYLKEQKKQSFNEFIIRPVNLTIRFRTDLSQDSTLPTSTVSMTMTPIIVNIDFTIANEIQALLKLRDYHSEDLESKVMKSYKNASTGDDSRFERLNTTRSKNQDTKFLMELLKLKMCSQYYDSIDKEFELLAFENTDEEVYFAEISQVDEEIKKLKFTLDVEKCAIAYNNAEKQFKTIKAEEDQRRQNAKFSIKSLVSWVPGFNSQANRDNENNEIDENFEELIAKYSSLINREVETEGVDKTTFQMTIEIPLFELILFNRATPSSYPQMFCIFRLQDLMYCRKDEIKATPHKRVISSLLRIEDVNIVNRSKVIERFEVILKKKPKITNMTEDESDEFLSRINSEIEEELEPIENDGLPVVQTFAGILDCSTSPPLILFEYVVNSKPSSFRNVSDTNEVDIKLAVNHFEFYFDRVMINGVMSNILELQTKIQAQANQNMSKFHSEAINLNKSKSMMNTTMRSKTIRRLNTLKDAPKSPSTIYNSIDICFSGVSLYIPDSLSFKNNSNKVLCIFIGETRLTSGEKKFNGSNLLVDEESELNFEDIELKNKHIMNGLNQIKHSEHVPQEYQKYDISIFDVNVVFLTNLNSFMSEIPIDDQDICEDARILQRFDMKLMIES